uniref:Uncharacterized protein n=1 Tax=Ixodes ricinus TaxID=34613 RepID=A0A6B0UK00_IXORI
MKTTTRAVLVWGVSAPLRQHAPSSRAVTFSSYLSLSRWIGPLISRITPVLSSIWNMPEVVPLLTKPKRMLSPSLSLATTVVTSVEGPAFSSTLGVYTSWLNLGASSFLFSV